MNLYWALHHGTFRNLVTIVVPGFVASLPFYAVVYFYLPTSLGGWFAQTESGSGASAGTGHPVLFTALTIALVLAAAVLAGMLADGLGRHIEVCWDGTLAKERPGDVTLAKSEWYRYLRLPVPTTDPDCGIVADGYLASIVLRLRFELNISAALLLCLVGMLWQYLDPTVLYHPNWLAFLTVVGAFACFCFYELRLTVLLLSKTRRLILLGPLDPVALVARRVGRSDADTLYFDVENGSVSSCEEVEVGVSVYSCRQELLAEKQFDCGTIEPRVTRRLPLDIADLLPLNKATTCDATITWKNGTKCGALRFRARFPTAP